MPNPRKKNSLFRLQHHEDLETVNQLSEDRYFDDAFAAHGDAAWAPRKNFVGSVISKKRYKIAMLAVVGVLFVFVGKTSALQVFQGDTYRLQAENNRIRRIVLPAQRGIIYDRKGIILAQNNPTFQITSSKNQLPTDELTRARLFTDLSEMSGASQETIESRYAEAESYNEEILLVDELDYETAMRFAARAENYSGAHLVVGSQRNYITSLIPSLSHVLGYTAGVSPEEYENFAQDGYRRFDVIGKQGIEAMYEEKLRGTFGEEILEIDALGRTERAVSKRDPVDGENITLNIDSTFQSYIENVLQARLEGTAAEKASVVAMNPHNGEIYALVSWPAYDANLFTQGIDQETYRTLLNDERRPLFPRAYAGEFPSGSTIKPVYAAAGLIEGLITPTTTFLSTGGLGVSVWFFPDWRSGGHGVTNVYHAIADSVNTFFYILGGGYKDTPGLGLEKLMAYAKRFGFGVPSGVDLTGEADGFLPSKDWKQEYIGEQWYIGDTYNTSIGQGYFLATPLQVARSTAVFANGGYLVTPRLNSTTAEVSEPIIGAETAQVVKDAMRQTVTAGSAKYLQSVAVPVAGKTGTAQWSSTEPDHSWFTGFAPYDDPEIVVTVLVEEGADASLAVPVTKEILDWWFAGR